MRIPDPKANTTTEAYLAYKAGYLEESELKPVLYEPYLHFDGWLAYWAGLTTDYPNKGPEGKNLIGLSPRYTGPGIYNVDAGHIYPNTKSTEVTIDSQDENSIVFTSTGSYSGALITSSPVDAGKTYIMTGSIQTTDDSIRYTIYTLDASYTVVRKVANSSSGDINKVIPIYAGEKFIGIAGRGNSANYTATISNLQLEEGDTATEYEPYYAIPEMLTDEEALVAYLSGVTNTYPEEIKDPYDVRIVGYLKYLVSVRWGRPEYPVNNEEFYLSTMKPPVVPSGDTPSSDIEMDDTAEAPFIDLKMYGDTEQQTYTGKNKVFFSPITTTSNGIEWIVTNDTISASGTATSNWSIPVGYASFASPLPAGQYTFSIPTVIDKSLQLNLREKDNTSHDINIMAGEKSVTFTTTYTSVSFRFALRAESGTTTNINLPNQLQLETGSTATSYEPYVGGVTAPNPDYPQDVNVVTGRQVVNIKNQNLFDWQSLDHTNTNDVINATLNETLDNGVIVTGNVSSSTADFAASKGSYQPARGNSESGYRVHIPEGSTVSVSADITLLKTGYHASTRLHLDRAIGGGYGTTGEGTALVLGEKIRVSATFQNVEEGYYWPTFMLNSNYMKIENIQMELSDSPTQYGEYGNANYEINLGKNLFTFGSGSGKFQGITWTRNGNTAVGVGTTTGSYTDTGTRIDLPAPLKAGQDYVFSIPAPVSFGCSLYLFDKNDQVVSPSAKINVGETSVVFNKDVDIYKARITLSDYGGAGKELNIELRAQIELGSTATGYAPQFEPIELCKIGDYQDYIYRDEDGDWYLHKETNKFVANGSESEWSSSAVSGGRQFFIPLSGVSLVAPRQIYCDRFYYITGSTDENTTYVNSTGLWVIYKPTSNGVAVATTTNEFKTWLGSNITTTYYALATATDTQITNSELISQLDALMEGGSYTGKTYITITSTAPNLPALLKVEAGKYD